MDCESFWRANGLINLEQRDVTGPPGEPTGSPFPRGGRDQACLGQLGQDPADEAGTSVHTSGNVSRANFPTPCLTQASHDVGCNRELCVGRHIVTIIITEYDRSSVKIFCEDELSFLLIRSTEAVLRQRNIRTHDLGGGSSTIEITDTVCELLESELVKV
jgi:hypothetical protein